MSNFEAVILQTAAVQKMLIFMDSRRTLTRTPIYVLVPVPVLMTQYSYPYSWVGVIKYSIPYSYSWPRTRIRTHDLVLLLLLMNFTAFAIFVAGQRPKPIIIIQIIKNNMHRACMIQQCNLCFLNS